MLSTEILDGMGYPYIVNLAALCIQVAGDRYLSMPPCRVSMCPGFFENYLDSINSAIEDHYYNDVFKEARSALGGHFSDFVGSLKGDMILEIRADARRDGESWEDFRERWALVWLAQYFGLDEETDFFEVSANIFE